MPLLAGQVREDGRDPVHERYQFAGRGGLAFEDEPVRLARRDGGVLHRTAVREKRFEAVETPLLVSVVHREGANRSHGRVLVRSPSR